jgi:hypothetical protein
VKITLKQEADMPTMTQPCTRKTRCPAQATDRPGCYSSGLPLKEVVLTAVPGSFLQGVVNSFLYSTESWTAIIDLVTSMIFTRLLCNFQQILSLSSQILLSKCDEW